MKSKEWREEEECEKERERESTGKRESREKGRVRQSLEVVKQTMPTSEIFQKQSPGN